MIKLAADLVVLVHVAFIGFVCLGGLLVLRQLWWMWLHVPAAVWGALVELGGFYCPLTSVEVALRREAGEAGYTGGFIDQYIWPLLYPEALTRNDQIALGGVVILVNLIVYGLVWRRYQQEE